MMFVDYETGEILDTEQVYKEMSTSLTQIKNCYMQLRKHKILTNDLHQRTFYSCTDLMQYIIYDIKKAMESLDKSQDNVK